MVSPGKIAKLYLQGYCNVKSLVISAIKYESFIICYYLQIQAAQEEYIIAHWNAGLGVSENLLVNGRGRFFLEEFANNPRYNKTGILKENKFERDHLGRELRKLPLATFFVTPGKRYRFRVMNPGYTLCPIIMWIEGHNLTIIASDTGSVTPVEAKSLILESGER